MLFAAVLVHPVSVRTKRELSSDPGCPSKLWDKLIQHMRDDHCVDMRRHRDSARARRDQDNLNKKKEKLTQHRTLGNGGKAAVAAWLLTAWPISRRDLPDVCQLAVHPPSMFTTSWNHIGQPGGPAGEIATLTPSRRAPGRTPYPLARSLQGTTNSAAVRAGLSC